MMGALPNHIRSQLLACKRSHGIWSGCPPDSGRVDAELRYMLDSGLVKWAKHRGGYMLTQRGGSYLPRTRAKYDTPPS